MNSNSLKIMLPTNYSTDADYADDIALLANVPAQAETLLHSLEPAAAGVGLHVNAHKTEYMRFNQRVDISALNSSKVKLATIVEGDPKAPFSIATTPRCRGGRYSIPRIAPLYP